MRSKAFQWQFTTFVRILFGLHLVYSGAAYVFFGWVPSAFHNPASPVGHFMVELDRIDLYPVVKHIELLLGILVLSNLFVPLAAVMELPITIMIAYLNIFVEGAIAPRHYYTGIQELAINGAVLLGYGAYYRTMLEPRARPQWVFSPLEPSAEAASAGDVAVLHRRDGGGAGRLLVSRLGRPPLAAARLVPAAGGIPGDAGAVSAPAAKGRMK